jgi:dCMP deaminase
MNWDKYYLGLCKAAGTNSKCHSRQIGSVLVKDKVVISTGYNGPARGIPECRLRLHRDHKINKILTEKYTENEIDEFYEKKICPRKVLGFPSGEGLEWCNAVHSEKNCLLAAARLGIATKGATLYIDAEISPCTQCYSAAIQAGIKEIVVIKNNIYDVSLEYCIEYGKLPIREFDI